MVVISISLWLSHSVHSPRHAHTKNLQRVFSPMILSSLTLTDYSIKLTLCEKQKHS